MKRLFFFFVLIFLTPLFVACGESYNSNNITGPIDTPTQSSQSTMTPSVLAIGNFQEYPLPETNSGLMRPTIDSTGRVWFGEMGHNFLASFDPHTQKFQELIPPNGHSGIMGIVVGPDDTIWFAEQYANYIGHYLPKTGQFQTFALPTFTIPDPNNSSKKIDLPSAPNDLVLDKHGMLWFTELNADSIGRLDTMTGQIQQYPLSPTKSIQTLNPYGITVDPQGVVWFTEASNSKIGSLDPSTGTIRYFTKEGMNLPLMEIVSDAHGILWTTGFNKGLLLRFDPQTGEFTSYFAPFTGNGAGGMYGVAITPSGEIWITVTAENVIARLDVNANHFVYYHIPTEGSLPLGLVIGANHTIWFTEAGTSKVGMLVP